MSEVDLHIHSTVSDGRLSPADIVHKAAELGLTVIAITDHDTTDGIKPAQEAAQKKNDIESRKKAALLDRKVCYSDPSGRTGIRR